MSHKLKDFATLRNKEVAWCMSCAGVVQVVHKPRVGGGIVKRCAIEQKEKARRVKQNERKQSARRSKAALKRLEEDAAYLWRQIVFERAGRCCEICGKGPFEKGDFQLQAHHLIKRSQSRRLLLDPANGAALCAGHHQWADRDNFGCIAYVEPRDPGLCDYLVSERRSKQRRTLEDEIVILNKVAPIYGLSPIALQAEQEAA